MQRYLTFIEAWFTHLVNTYVYVDPRTAERLEAFFAPLGFVRTNDSGPFKEGWQGSVDGIPVVVAMRAGELVVSIISTPPGLVSITRNTMETGVLSTGDVAFDRSVGIVHTDETQALRLLGCSQRRFFEAATRNRWRFWPDHGWVISLAPARAADLSEIVDEGIELGRLGRYDPEQALFDRLSDPVASIRRKAAVAILDRPLYAARWRSLLGDGDPHVRLVAGARLHERATLDQLLDSEDPRFLCDVWLAIANLKPPDAAVVEAGLCASVEVAYRLKNDEVALTDEDLERMGRVLAALERAGTSRAIRHLADWRQSQNLPTRLRSQMASVVNAIRKRSPQERGELFLCGPAMSGGELSSPEAAPDGFVFELCLMHPDGSLARVRTASVHASLRASTFRLGVGEVEQVGEAWNLGPLGVLVEQLAEVPSRLRRGEPAIVRSGVDDEVEVPYYVFLPGDPVRVSAFFVRDRGLGRLYPILRYDETEVDRLYRAFQAHGERWIAEGGPDTFRGLELSREPLLAAIRREVAAARVLLGQ